MSVALIVMVLQYLTLKGEVIDTRVIGGMHSMGECEVVAIRAVLDNPSKKAHVSATCMEEDQVEQFLKDLKQ